MYILVVLALALVVACVVTRSLAPLIAIARGIAYLVAIAIAGAPVGR